MVNLESLDVSRVRGLRARPACGLESLPIVLVIGQDCEPAIRPLFDADRPGVIPGPEMVFSDFEGAWDALQVEMAELDARLWGKAKKERRPA